MGNKRYISRRTKNIVVALLGLGFLIITAISIVSPLKFIDRPFPGFLVFEGNVVGLRLLNWPGFQNGIMTNDIVLKVNGRSVATARELYREIDKFSIGTRISYQVIRQEVSTEIKAPLSRFTMRDYLLIVIPLFFNAAFFMVVGLLVFYMRPNSYASGSILVFSAAMALSFLTQLSALTTNRLELINHLAFAFIGPSLILLALNFPIDRKPSGKMNVLMSIIFLLGLPYFFLNWPSHLLSHSDENLLARFQAFTETSGLIFFVCLLIAPCISILSFFKSNDALVRQKGKVVTFGFIVTMIIFSVLIQMLKEMPIVIFMPLGLVFHGSLVYSILKRNLFDVDEIILRSVSYLAVSGIVIALLLAGAGVINLLLREITGQSSEIAAVLTMLIIVLVVPPLRNRTDLILSRRFFPERYRYQETISDLSAALVTVLNLPELLEKTLGTVLEAIEIKKGCVFLYDEQDKVMRLASSRGYAAGTPLMEIAQDHPLLGFLMQSRKPLQITDLDRLPKSPATPEALASVISALDAVLVIPIIFKDRIIGLLSLSAKKSGALYSSKDIHLFGTLCNQIALSIENARQVEELKKLVEIETSYRELRRLDQLKDNFLSMVSHDLRTPMTSIKGYASILAEKLDRLDRDRQMRYLSIIIKESDRLTRLINDLLDLQRFEAGKMILDFKDLDLVSLVRDAVESFQGAAYARKQTIEYDPPRERMMAHADPDRISQVLANLLSNAVKFTPERGLIKIWVEKVREDDHDAVRVSVSDNGPGIPLELQGMLFNKFQQLDNVVKSREQGSGLGLALAREIVDHHRGKIGMESQPGQGATFFFTLNLLT